ncbi:MAG: hypothetical protein FWE91_09725 [Defluviitaleaceae bacterium]|nr:hypothetical protein [Defluviitaleaceae bacterium]
MIIQELNEAAKNIHALAVNKGWWEDDRPLPEILMLCVSELSEALEEYRNKSPDIYCDEYDEDHCDPCLKHRPACACNGHKPQGVAVELADCIIRILDFCGRKEIDIEAAINAKHEYNKTRPYRHGGKKC